LIVLSLVWQAACASALLVWRECDAFAQPSAVAGVQGGVEEHSGASMNDAFAVVDGVAQTARRA